MEGVGSTGQDGETKNYDVTWRDSEVTNRPAEMSSDLLNELRDEQGYMALLPRTELDVPGNSPGGDSDSEDGYISFEERDCISDNRHSMEKQEGLYSSVVDG